jgi:membrane-associated phospholipid phosphatase
MSKRALTILAVACAVIALLSIFLIDRPLATAVHGSGIENATFVVKLREFFDIFTGRFYGRGLVGNYVGLAQLLLGILFIVVGAIWTLARRGSRIGPGLAFAGVVQLATIETAWQVKDLFGRLRPFEVFKNGNWDHVWFAGGTSFPSGHNAFFWGLFLPLVYAFPRWRIPLLIVPVFIAFARIDESYHFLSDVLAGIALAALITLLGAVVFGRWVKPSAHRA